MITKQRRCSESIALVAALVALLSGSTCSAADEKTYLGSIGDVDAYFAIVWYDSSEVTGTCQLQDGLTLKVAGSNYAEGKLRLNLFAGDEAIGVGELAKLATGSEVSWFGQVVFADGSRTSVQFSRQKKALLDSGIPTPTASEGAASLELNSASINGSWRRSWQQDSDEDLKSAFRAGMPLTQDYKLPSVSLGAYEGFIGNHAVHFVLYWGEDKTVVGSAGMWDLVGINEREGEVNLRAFSRNEELGELKLRKSAQANPVTWVGEFAGKNGQTAPVRLARLPNLADLGRMHSFGDDVDQLKNYLMWEGNGEVTLDGLMGPLVSLTLGRAGDTKQPNIEVLEDLPADICAGLLLMDKKLVVTAHDKSITALDAETGGKLWSAHFPVSVDMAGLQASTDGNFIYVLGGTGGEVLGIGSLWRIPVSGSGEASELLRTWLPGSEGGLPAGASIAMRIPGTDKFVVDISDMQNSDVAASRKQSCGRRLFVFDAHEMSLSNVENPQHAFAALFSSQASISRAPTDEVALLASVDVVNAQSATIELIKRPRVLELISSHNGRKTRLNQWTLADATSSEMFWERPPLWFADGKVVGHGFSGKPIVLADSKEPGDFIYSAKSKREVMHPPEKSQESESKDFKILAYGDYFGLCIEITDKRSGEKIFDSVKNGLPQELQAVGYGENVHVGWLDESRMVMGLPTGQFLLVDCSKPKPVELLRSEDLPQSAGLFYEPSNRAVLSLSGTRLYKNSLDTEAEALTPQYFVSFNSSGPSAVVFPDNIYSGYRGAMEKISAVVNNRALPFEQFDLRLNRPDIVLERLGAPSEAVAIAKQLREKRLKRMGVTEEMLKPDFHVPELEIIGDVPSTADSDEINLVIKASDSKYPLERLRVYVNNVPVNGRDGELLREEAKSDQGLLGRIAGAFSEAATGPQTLERAIPIKLAAGRNKIQVSVLNNAGAESLYANAEVNCTAKRAKPILYAVALGVSDYVNPEWNLQYAAKDARDVLERLKSKSSGSYGEVKELLLTDKQVTKESLGQIKDFLKDATIDDTVLMFVAGHGLLDSNYDYYFGTTDIDFNNPAEKGIAFEEFDDLLASLPCLKKSLLIDTCHAGELDEEEKTLLASAGGTAAPLPTGTGIAMRSIGTRGMNVKAVEGARGASEWYDRLQGLFVDLRRGSGSTILSSSAGAEYALESSEQQNGLFTYAVLEALDGKKDADTNNDGAVQMSELGEYVKKRVSELTNNKQTPNTRRVNLEGDFTVAKAE